MSLSRRQVCRGLGALGLVQGVSARRAQAQPTGEAVWAWHVSLAPAWFDPVDTPVLRKNVVCGHPVRFVRL